MRKVGVVSVVLVVAALSAARATADPKIGESIAAVPQDTATFVTFCRDQTELCTNAVTDVENDVLIAELYGKYGCTYPTPQGDTRESRHAVRIAYTAKILAWLDANSASRMPMTKDAINQATAALWPAGCEQGKAVLHAQ
jgi:hypothetical protein